MVVTFLSRVPVIRSLKHCYCRIYVYFSILFRINQRVKGEFRTVTVTTISPILFRLLQFIIGSKDDLTRISHDIAIIRIAGVTIDVGHIAEEVDTV